MIGFNLITLKLNEEQVKKVGLGIRDAHYGRLQLSYLIPFKPGISLAGKSFIVFVRSLMS